MFRHSPFCAALVLSFVLVGTSCASDNAHFDVQVAPDFKSQGISLSVFGVFRDGRMSADTWDEIGPKLSPSFGSGMCDVAFGKRLFESDISEARAADDETRENGVTDDLLARFGRRAKGETILVVTVAGEVAKMRDGGTSASPSPPAQSMRSQARGGRRGRPMSGMSPGHSRAAEKSSLEMSASLFSVRLGHPVAVVSMTYSGSDAGEAVEKFRRELEKTWPGASCVGWDWGAP